MTLNELETAIAEAERFLEKAKICYGVASYTASVNVRFDRDSELSLYISPKLTAAVKRSSMDLSRALVKVRGK